MAFTDHEVAEHTMTLEQHFWKRADGKWHRYLPNPEAKSLTDALAVIHADASASFWAEAVPKRVEKDSRN